MRKYVLILSVLALIPTLTHAGWWKVYGGSKGDCGMFVQQTSDGGYIVTGYTYSFGAGRDDLWLLRTDENGDTIWTHTYGGEGLDYGLAVYQTQDGGYMVFGGTESFIGRWEIWILKTDSYGDTLWTRRYLGGISSAQPTSDGGYIIAGGNWVAGYLQKIDSLGDTLWPKKNYENFWQHALHFAEETSDGGYIATGEIAGTVCNSSLWLIKTDTEGDTVWTKRYWAGRETSFYRGYCVRGTSDRGFIIAGVDYDNPLSQSLYLIKTDSNGDTMWSYLHSKGISVPVCVEETSEGEYLVQGEYNPDYDLYNCGWLLKFNVTGDTLWSRQYGNGDEGCSLRWLQKTSDKGYIMTGSVMYDGSGKLWLIKTDSLGLVAVSEPVTPVTQPDWEVPVSIGRHITLRAPEGSQPLNLAVFDASGRKVDEIHSTLTQGSISWGQGFRPGVYFIRIEGDASATTHKVILIH